MPNSLERFLSEEVVARVDEHRGDIDRGEFINILLDCHLNKKAKSREQNPQNFVTTEYLENFEKSMKELLRSFLAFFIAYGLEIGKGSGDSELHALTERLNVTPKSVHSSRRRKSSIRAS